MQSLAIGINSKYIVNELHNLFQLRLQPSIFISTFHVMIKESRLIYCTDFAQCTYRCADISDMDNYEG